MKRIIFTCYLFIACSIPSAKKYSKKNKSVFFKGLSIRSIKCNTVFPSDLLALLYNLDGKD